MKKLLLQSSISAAFLSLSAVAAADNCASASAFVSGSAYNTGDVVIADGKAYQCQIAGWCQSTADLYYKPGSGFNWSDAWQEKSCDSTASSSTDESTTADNVVDNSINNATDITDTVSDELDESVTIVEEGASQ
ncbi:MAG: hypothetical protein HRU20_31200, partial [Pseudomonadales bacterium]|nr:hypothetical protein [Pseudomonadales bacterium]